MLSHLVAANRLWRESPCKRISNNFTTRKTKEIPYLAAQLNASSKEVDQWGDLTALCSVHMCRYCLLQIPVVLAHGKSHWLLTTRVQQLASKIWRFSRNQHFLRTLRLGSSKIWRFSCNQHLLRTWTQACVFKTQWKSINIPKNSAPKDSCVLKHDQNALF